MHILGVRTKKEAINQKTDNTEQGQKDKQWSTNTLHWYTSCYHIEKWTAKNNLTLCAKCSHSQSIVANLLI